MTSLLKVSYLNTMHGGSFYLFLLQHDEVPLKETASKEIDESDIDSCAADGNNVIA